MPDTCITPSQLTLGELIAELELEVERQGPDKVVAYGFGHPHSYRGFYECVAFTPVQNITVGQMLEYTQGALGHTYQGYKGGDYLMNEHTSVYLAEYGEGFAETLGMTLLSFMLGRI